VKIISAQSMIGAVLLCVALAQGAGPAQAQRAPGSLKVPTNQPQLILQTGHSVGVTNAAFSPDGHFVITGATDNAARLWEVSTGREIRRFVGEIAEALAYSPDGRMVAIGYADKSVRLWDVETGAEIRRIETDQKGLIQSLAYSPDGRLLATTGLEFDEKKGPDTIVHLWDVATGKEAQRFTGHTDNILAVAFSPDSRFVLSGGWDGSAHLWDAATGRDVQKFKHPRTVMSLAFAPDDQSIVTGCADGNAYVWNRKTGREVLRLDTRALLTGPVMLNSVQAVAYSADSRTILIISGDHTDPFSNRANRTAASIWDAASGKQLRELQDFRSAGGSNVATAEFSADGRYALTADGTVRLWDVATGREERRLVGYSSRIRSGALSNDGRWLVTVNGSNTLNVWDTTTGQQSNAFKAQSEYITSAAISPDSRYVLTGSQDKTARLWDVETGRETRSFLGHTARVDSVAYSPDGRLVATGGFDDTARIWEVATGKELKSFNHHFTVESIAFSPQSDRVVIAGGNFPAELWDLNSGQLLGKFEGDSGAIDVTAFSPDGQFIFTGGLSDSSYLWDAGTGKQLQRLQLKRVCDFAGCHVSCATFSADSKTIVTGHVDGTAHLWDTATGQEKNSFAGHQDSVDFAAFVSQGRFIVTGSVDGTLRLWNSAGNGKELCQLISLSNGDWAVVEPGGRFDTNNLEEIKGLYWIVPDEPMKPLPLEIFMRDYYEPNLLVRIMQHEQFDEIRSLAKLNRLQPEVKISSVEPQKDSELVTVTVEVKSVETLTRGGIRGKGESGVFDLRLFRDGQLVGQIPRPVSQRQISAKAVRTTADDQLRDWRESTEVKVDRTGRQRLKFENIKLPQRVDKKQVQFSAYAFNQDRVKSITDQTAFNLAAPPRPRKGRAYLVGFGVNAYQNSNWNLNFAASDVRLTQRALQESLSATGNYQDVVLITLVSDYKQSDGRILEKTATKENLRAVLELLSSSVDPQRLLRDRELLKGIPNTEKLQPAGPDDLLVISISSHGEYEKGNFYFLPYEIGAGRGQNVTNELLRRSISGDDLSSWLRDVDAGELVLIADACHSAATVETEGFKPGPMGSRGLGQLAYDKGMMILAASQANDAAREGYGLGKSLLTHALICEGLGARKADRNRDHEIALSEWLAYGVERVPKLHREVETGSFKAVEEGNCGATAPGKASGERGRPLLKISMFQQPSYFNFARNKQDPVLSKR
jgi:WD40 repeat protein